MSKRLSYFTCLVLAVCLGGVARAEINYEYIEAAAGVNFHALADVDWAAVVRSATSDTLTAGDGNWVEQCGPHRGGYGDTGEDFAFRWHGYIIVPVSGAVTFYVRSDDGSILLIDDEVVIDNDGDHGTEGFPGDPGTVTLTAGAHKIEARMYERGGGNTFYLNWDVEGPTNITAVPDSALYPSPPRQAMLPNPVDGAESIGKWFNGGVIQWGSGMDIAWHNVYFGTNPTPGAAEKRSRQALGNTFLFPDMYLARQPGTTYYWRIDEEAADGTIFTGEVWSFTTAPSAAHLPTPLDGQKWLDPCGITLEWRQGFDATTQDVYFGTDQAAVANATTASGEFIGNQATTFYSPGVLAEDTTYYWRIDQLNGGTEKGQVWKFSTVGKEEGLRGEYYLWSDLPSIDFGYFVLTRIDPQINFNWGSGSPAPDVNVDLFAARWLGELETASTGSYTFYTNTDDGVRLWIDDQLIIDNWTDHSPTIDTGSIDLLGDQRYSIQMDYYENGGGAVAELRWEGPSTPLQLVPPGALSLPLRATRPRPANGATGLGRMITLSWAPGELAVRHDVFFGENPDAVANATTATPGIYKGRQDLNDYVPPALLSIGKTYYWRIDEVNNVHPESPRKGSIWSFTTLDHILVDDFEDYNDYTPDRIFEWWKDGFGYGAPESPPYYQGNGTGSIVGYATPTFVETNILHGGSQAMPYFFNNNLQNKAKYSEAIRRLSYPTRNWAEEGVRALSLWYRGYPALRGGYTYDAGAGTYTVRAAGTDIWNVSDPVQAGYHDEFHFVYQTLDGAGTIQARVESVQNTNGWAKAGVMIRDTLDANSVHSMVVVTPANGVAWQYRMDVGGASTNNQVTGISAPQWVRITRDVSGLVTGEYSGNAVDWTTIGTPLNIPMDTPMYIGLCLTSHNAAAICEAVFSNVSFPNTTTGGVWAGQDIGMMSNDPEEMYVAISNTNGATAVVYHPDPNAILTTSWTEWNIPLTEFSNRGVTLTDVNDIRLGFGTRGNMTTPGGSGTAYFDDIRLYKSRCFPNIIKPVGDFSNNCVVDLPDLEIMVDNWLVSNYEVTPIPWSPLGLVAAYMFEGNLADVMGGHNADPCGTVAYATGKVNNWALDLADGAYASTKVTASALGIGGDRPKSVTAWVYTRSFNGGGIFDMGDNVNGQNFSLRTMGEPNVWRAQRYGYPTYDFDFTYPSLNEWVHMALVYDGNDAGNRSYAYANGELVGTQVIRLDTADTRTFAIGVWSGNYFDGLIDDLRVYKRALPQAEVGTLAGRTGTYTQPLYPLLTPQDPAINMHSDGRIDFKDYAMLMDMWLEELLWP